MSALDTCAECKTDVGPFTMGLCNFCHEDYWHRKGKTPAGCVLVYGEELDVYEEIRRWARKDFSDREKYEILTQKHIGKGVAFVTEEEPDYESD